MKTKRSQNTKVLSSKAKGDAFEDKIFEQLKPKLENGELLVDGKRSYIYQRKQYYSRDRESNIIVDISIETFLPGADNYSILTVFECKDYGETVPVDDIEEFDNKLSQINANKGIIVTTSKFSSTGIRYATNKGIGLIRIVNEDLKFEAYRKEKFGITGGYENITNILCGETTPSKPYYILDNYQFKSIESYLLQLKIIDTVCDEKKEIKVPFLSSVQMQVLTEKILPSEVLEIIQPTPLGRICEILEKKYKAKFIFSEDLGSENGKDILGKISFTTFSIYISTKLERNSHRWRFTLAHEIAHFVLHYKILSKFYNEGLDTMTNLFATNNLFNDVQKRIEIQANIFASCLLMPKIPFYCAVIQSFKNYNINRGRLFLDDQQCNQDNFHLVASQIGELFQVSKEAVKYRLISLNLLEGVFATSVKDVLMQHNINYK